MTGTPSPKGWNLEHSYASLPADFFSYAQPTPVRAPTMLVWNRSLAECLGLAFAEPNEEAWTQVISGNRLPLGAKPLAQAYAGHQFGHFTMLGDGRAILLGEQIAPDGARFDIQLKGPGPTPYSRRGDGRAAVGPMLREYLISEAMHALGIPTTRSLAVVSTGEPVYRESVLPGAVLARVASSHLRVGTFEFAAAFTDRSKLETLADHAIARHDRDLAGRDDRILLFLERVVDRQAKLCAHWMLVGFVHGVMNTDNTTISGETIDYGPCAFLDAYDPQTVFSSIDRNGRYAYANQPQMLQWNLARLAEALMPLIHEDPKIAVIPARSLVESFMGRFLSAWMSGMREKLGLDGEDTQDRALVDRFLAWMADRRADYTTTFRNLSNSQRVDALAAKDPTFAAWRTDWRNRQRRAGRTPDEISLAMNWVNPAYIPRNHHVEAALQAAAEKSDLSLLHRLHSVLIRPFEEREGFAEYLSPGTPSETPYRTFCGT